MFNLTKTVITFALSVAVFVGIGGTGMFLAWTATHPFMGQPMAFDYMMGVLSLTLIPAGFLLAKAFFKMDSSESN